MKIRVKFNLEIGRTALSEIREFDDEADTPEDIEEELNSWVDGEVDRWYEVIS